MTSWISLARRARDDRGSLPLVLLITLVGTMMSAALVPVLITQFHSSRFDSTRVQALDAAQAGIDVALGQIRNATTAGAGDAKTLPCGPLTGTVDDAGKVGYQVGIQYYLVDPTAQPSARVMSCVPGYGTYDSTTGAITPAWAKVTAKGTSGTGAGGGTNGRTLVTTYQFKTNNLNIAGGVIRIFPASATSAALCLDAGSATPVAGTKVLMQPCSTTTPATAAQVFVYRTDLTVQLLSSATTAVPNGMCLSYATNAVGTFATFAACNALGTTPPYNQQWSFNDNGALQASTSTTISNGTLATTCLDVSAQTAATAPTLQTCTGGTTSARQAWIPSPAVGAGAAVAPQWVNYYEFGRCIDVTNQNVNSTYLIDYPCKQNPYPNSVAWNQKFTFPTIGSGSVSATGQMSTITSGTNYCLTSPLTNGGLVTVKTCSSTRADQTWTVYNNDDSLAYKMKFTIVDSVGLCLSLTAAQSGMVWSTVDVETCVGRADQKWNAAPTTSTVLNTQEK